MQNYPAPAQALVAEMTTAAEADPARAVAFQGAPGANSHIAVLEAFPNSLPVPCFSFEDALDAVRDLHADCAVIPIENSLHGRVADMHFLLPESGLVIIGEHFLHVRHTLMALPGHGKITQVMSHPQALGQCRHWLRANGIAPVAFPDTAGAAAAVAEAGDPHVAALAPSISAGIYGLKVVEENVSDSVDNTTRFVVLAREGRDVAIDDGPLMTTFIFAVKNIPAALYKALGGFATNGVNMTKLESYQRGASFSATEFYADIEGHPDEPHIRRALEELAFHTKWVRLLGTYPRARERGFG
ncbi:MULTISPECIES: prephenate dehydratase [unclassified Sphingomonas]|uniref:prephenate dehydratase n=1 Tax=unclassified Sphingomonas TaxID=196159 RepID=UPI0006F5EE42|nr:MULTISPECIES: prephenate dehydratase [unclassified Sphingomonas]KQX19291.1 prephenate dehydratase [Sphingomonas sp. Root1294]KQY65495.1 prephenate dehydratase [Sphingomonas sp. Root50]KRB95206.1 prephenate dehydratase [Sphingomonas sp. Root720]